MELLIKLLLAHLIGDFVLQSGRWLKQKEAKGFGAPFLYVHVLFHGLLVLLLTWDFAIWLPAVIIAVSHGFIDGGKAQWQSEKYRKWWFAGDQLMHLLVIAVVWYVWSKPEGGWPVLSAKMWIPVTAYLFVTAPASVIIKTFIGQWAKDTGDKEGDSLEQAGQYIGILERLFVLTFVVTGNWNAIGFLVAAKSVFRFGDLKESKNRKLTEYILIGTLTSFGLAMFTGIIVNQLMGI